jgi:hypothetical protein
MTRTEAYGRHYGWKGGTPDRLQRHVAVAHALVGGVEAHGRHGVRTTSDEMTIIGCEVGRS